MTFSNWVVEITTNMPSNIISRITDDKMILRLSYHIGLLNNALNYQSKDSKIISVTMSSIPVLGPIIVNGIRTLPILVKSSISRKQLRSLVDYAVHHIF